MAKGFTLIEVIVVLIILGVLASVALTSYFSWIERSRASEAQEQIKNLNNLVSACMQVRTINECNDFGVNNTNTTHFFYAINGCNNGTGTPCWTILARRNNFENPRPDQLSDILQCPGAGQWLAITGLVLCHNTDGLGNNQMIANGSFAGLI